MKYTQGTLEKIEKVLDEADYVIRYERGTFQSGYCILEQKKVVVLNKFLQLEGRNNTLVDIISKLVPNPDVLSPEARKTFAQVHAKASFCLALTADLACTHHYRSRHRNKWWHTYDRLLLHCMYFNRQEGQAPSVKYPGTVIFNYDRGGFRPRFPVPDA